MLALTIRKYHKWLSLIIGIQALLWLISGAYMVIVNLDYIHGDHLVRKMQEPIPISNGLAFSFSDVRTRYPGASTIRLTTWMGMPHYQVIGAAEAHLLDAQTGELRSPLSAQDAEAVAMYHYTGAGMIVSSVLYGPESELPGEVQTRPLPLWQINFDDFGSTAFYISPDLGHLVTRRHTLWRVFDFVWMLHIMDYQNRSDVNNNLFRVAATLGLAMSFFGIWLLYFSFRKSNSNARRAKSKRGFA